MGKKVFVIDVARCNGCHCCQIACKDEHVGNDWTPVAKPQPEIGQFWLDLTERVRGTVPKVKVAYRPHLCMHCDKAPCIESCPIPGALYKRDDAMVIIDPVKCTGCRNCVDACPYDVIFFNEALNIAQKCTACAHLLDDGWAEPRCVDACPTLCLKFMDEAEAEALLAEGEVWKPEIKDQVQPRVYYLNLPKKFIGGTVYDPVEEEVVIGAAVAISGSKGANVSVQTDSYGDFWVEGLPEDVFEVTIQQDGKKRVFSDVSTLEADVNLGDIALT